MIEVREVVTDQEWQEYMSIRNVVFVQEQNVSEEDEIDAYEKESTHFIATLDGQPAGTGRFRLKKGFIKFERVATLKKFRGKGIASAIMDLMEKRAKMKHSDYLPAMHAQIDAVSLYAKRGWTPLGAVFDESGIDHQLMVLLPKNTSHLKCLKDPDTPQAVREFLLKFQK
ncbi:MAG: GNAT family N-acetyltransferase [Simkaniaceae bacterium]|nr:MAG: GNAT family N-acetyltransferase [Simkaniaceae bacterium]